MQVAGSKHFDHKKAKYEKNRVLRLMAAKANGKRMGCYLSVEYKDNDFGA